MKCVLDLTHPSAHTPYTHTHLEQWTHTHTHTPGAVDTHTPEAVDTHTHTRSSGHTHTVHSGEAPARPPHVTLYKIQISVRSFNGGIFVGYLQSGSISGKGQQPAERSIWMRYLLMLTLPPGGKTRRDPCCFTFLSSAFELFLWETQTFCWCPLAALPVCTCFLYNLTSASGYASIFVLEEMAETNIVPASSCFSTSSILTPFFLVAVQCSNVEVIVSCILSEWCYFHQWPRWHEAPPGFVNAQGRWGDCLAVHVAQFRILCVEKTCGHGSSATQSITLP